MRKARKQPEVESNPANGEGISAGTRGRGGGSFLASGMVRRSGDLHFANMAAAKKEGG